MTATLHRDNWEQYAAICEQKITSLEAEIERLRAVLDFTTFALEDAATVIERTNKTLAAGLITQPP